MKQVRANIDPIRLETATESSATFRIDGILVSGMDGPDCPNGHPVIYPDGRFTVELLSADEVNSVSANAIEASAARV